MKAITVYQPWASLIWLAGHPDPEIARMGKHNETRGWAPKHRGPLAIHASKDRRFLDLVCREPFKVALESAGISDKTRVDLPLGAVIATCRLVDCLEIGAEYMSKWGSEIEYPLPRGNELAFGDYTPGRYTWILEDVKQLPEPIPVRGMQGLWDWEPAKGVLLFRE